MGGQSVQSELYSCIHLSFFSFFLFFLTLLHCCFLNLLARWRLCMHVCGQVNKRTHFEVMKIGSKSLLVFGSGFLFGVYVGQNYGIPRLKEHLPIFAQNLSDKLRKIVLDHAVEVPPKK
eukprot:TRINITY_DN27353_c0_g1_i1.p1 TRINITY_DN27353_c0_g1~~TRINITY_DN27353_c0_g1_i1.p1  ORF type:complete len:119 (+),score=10.67 TRINITY_DN27353_c0_g1_i1:100-456(+)